jgi:peptidoglycan hydrolase-like protein with peptidoglycan-binding domain
MKVSGIFIGLLTAGLLTAAPAFAAKPASKKPPAANTVHSSPVANGNIPEADRLAIQANLAWISEPEAILAGGDFDEKTLAAIKGFQQRHGGKPTGVLSDDERAALVAAVKGRQDAVGWRIIDDPATGSRLGIPGTLVPRTGATRMGSHWASAHGQIEVETFRLREAALPALFEDAKKTRHRVVDRSTLKPDSFVMSGMQGLKMFVERVQASGGELHGITVLYDQATEGVMGPIAVAMADTFQGFPDPNADPPPGSRRSVDYGTAIVVSDRGHLLAAAHVVEQCQSITIAGLGHAERIAVDGSGDLALLRLYGARDLVPAAIDGEAATTDNLNLVGIADPMSPASDGSVARATVHMTAQGLDPAPKPGFSGAAAVDPQGHFAGMVDLKWPLVAGTAVAGHAALVPADAIAAFLKSQRIAPAAGHGAIDQSVLRVICVRK